MSQPLFQKAIKHKQGILQRRGFFLLVVFSLAWAFGGLSARKLYTDGLGIAGIAKNYLGVPYKYGGSTPAGFDCSGFTAYVYHKAGYRIPRGAKAQYEALNPLRVPQIGDLVFFKIQGRRVSHVGIYVGNFQFIHAPRTGKNVGYADLRIKYWKKRYAGARTIFRAPSIGLGKTKPRMPSG